MGSFVVRTWLSRCPQSKVSGVILSGTGQVLCDGVYEPLGPGACHYCPKGHAHSLQNTGPLPLEFFAVVPEEP